ncbi:uncharacterized protein [Watersipora subatra]|uniref:uncharacterized protein n=1 Tax=Watersipora subatra TaxID=2589382 RepID=UPI00355C98EB
MACVNANGDKMPPFVIFKGKDLWDNWIPKSGDWPNKSYAASANGWMTSELFLNWFTKSFVPHVKGETPCLLIFDGHGSHVTVHLIKAAQMNGITIIKLLAHTSHILQPLNVACFRGLKAKWDQKLTVWQRLHVGSRPGKAEFAKLLGNVWADLTASNMISGFRGTGIYDGTIVGDLKVNRFAVSQKV